MIWMRGENYYEYWKSNIDNSKRTAINTRAIWVVISPDSIRRTVVIIIGLVMIGIGWYKKQGMIIKFLDIWKNSKKIHFSVSQQLQVCRDDNRFFL